MEKYTASEWAAMEGGHEVPSKKLFEFINDEMTEARLFKNPKQFVAQSGDDIAANVYAHLLGVQAMRYTDPGRASTYARNTLKYLQLDPKKRHQLRQQWNQPITWPLKLLGVLLLCILVPLIIIYWRRERRPAVKRMKD